jgi:hypothetical protein
MQEVGQKAQHTGQDNADLSIKQICAEEALPVVMISLTDIRTAIVAHKRMTVLELKELYRVCSYACKHAMCTCI